ncbi:MAG: helicase C-terminal domain-containing protein, partial [Planctomycetota bacterium]
HGEAQRSTLLDRFRRQEPSVLFGTDSFWEGVDVKGSALELVIITRLPFRPPDDPLTEARQEEIASRGQNPFAHFTVPRAVLKFKQGFGRLIRSETDRGAVAVLDSRVITKNYGKTFLKAVPRTKFLVSSSPEIARAVGEFLSAPAPKPFAEPPRSAEPEPPPWGNDEATATSDRSDPSDPPDSAEPSPAESESQTPPWEG